eukprot:gene11138-3198_t
MCKKPVHFETNGVNGVHNIRIITMAGKQSAIIARHNGKEVTLKITASEIVVVPLKQSTARAGYLSINDIYGVQIADKDKNFVEIYALLYKSDKRVERVVPLECSNESQASRIIDSLRTVLSGDRPRRHVLIIINPFGGRRKAPKIFESTIKRMLDRANISYDVIRTTHKAHATEIGKTLNVALYTEVLTVSGDGLFNELINGLVTNPNQDAVARLPIGLIPAGSGNGLCQTIHAPTPIEATFAVIKGHTRALDLFRVEQPDSEPLYSFLQVSAGVLADTDIESERFRWAGPARFTISGLHRILALRKYNFKIWFFPEYKAEDVPDESLRIDAFPSDDPAACGWQLFDGRLVSVLLANASWASDEFLMAPYASLEDGCIDFVVLDDTVTTGNLVSWFLSPEQARHVGAPQVKYIKAKAVRLEPVGQRGIFTVDGEVINSTITHVTVVPRALQLLVPANTNPFEWDPAKLPPSGLNID